ncbi:MAG: DUF4272 domain-containing protein [Phycisphaerales bacterium]
MAVLPLRTFLRLLSRRLSKPRIDLRQIRAQSVGLAGRHRIAVPTWLPLLDSGLTPRSREEVIGRSLAITAVSATCNGLNKEVAREWVTSEGLGAFLTPSEHGFLYEGLRGRPAFLFQIEGLWALLWALGFVDQLDHSQVCSERLVTLLPDLRVPEPSGTFRALARLRKADELLQELDLEYCLHSAICDAELRGRADSLSLVSYAVVERRRALEWLMSGDAWDDVELNT